MTLRRWSALSSLGGDAKKASTFANEKDAREPDGRRREGDRAKEEEEEEEEESKPRKRWRRRKRRRECSSDERKDHSEKCRKVRARGEGQGTFAKKLDEKGTTTTTTTKENLTIDELARMKPRGTGTKSRIDGR